MGPRYILDIIVSPASTESLILLIRKFVSRRPWSFFIASIGAQVTYQWDASLDSSLLQFNTSQNEMYNDQVMHLHAKLMMREIKRYTSCDNIDFIITKQLTRKVVLASHQI